MMSVKYFAPDDNPCVSEMTCSICLNVWMDPVEIKPCCHTYCTTCLGSLKECPDCRNPIKEKGKPNRIISNLLHVLVGTCTRCGWKGTHGEYCSTHATENCVAPPSSRSIQSSAHNSISTRQPLANNNNVATTAAATSSVSNRLSHTDPHDASFPPNGDFPALPRQQSGFAVGGGAGDLSSVTEDGTPTCMLFPSLPDANDVTGNNTGLEQRDGTSSVVMISTTTRPWVGYGLTKEQYDSFTLAFFAFADVVNANEAPYPQMAADDRDREDPMRGHDASTSRAPPSSLSRRTIMLLRPEAVKRCLWWLNLPSIEHDAIVDELFPSFDIHLPLIQEKAEKVNDDRVLRPLEGPLAPPVGHENDETAKYIVYGVTMHQFLNWLSWNSDKLAPPLKEYGLSKEHYEAIVEYARKLDQDQTGAFDPDTIAELIKNVVEIRKTGVASPVSIRPSEVNRILAQRRYDATQQASSRETAKLTLVGPRYPPGEYLLHDVLIACKHAEVGPDWDDIGDEESKIIGGKINLTPVPQAIVSMSSRASAASPNTAVSFANGSQGSQPVPKVSSATAPPPKKSSLLDRLFGKKTEAPKQTATAAQTPSPSSSKAGSPSSQASASTWQPRPTSASMAQPATTAPTFAVQPQQQPQRPPVHQQPHSPQSPQTPLQQHQQQQQRQPQQQPQFQQPPQNPTYVQPSYQQPPQPYAQNHYQQPAYGQPVYVSQPQQPVSVGQWASQQVNMAMNSINPRQPQPQPVYVQQPPVLYGGAPQPAQGLQYYNQYPPQQRVVYQPSYPAGYQPRF